VRGVHRVLMSGSRERRASLSSGGDGSALFSGSAVGLHEDQVASRASGAGQTGTVGSSVCPDDQAQLAASTACLLLVHTEFLLPWWQGVIDCACMC
jgi:hypothetical protein